jgi:hypothetical protein
MTTYFATPVRTLLLAMALTFATQAADARGNAADPPQMTARASARTKTDTDTTASVAERDGIPLGGILIIVGIVGVVIVLAWVASRMGDNRPSM